MATVNPFLQSPFQSLINQQEQPFNQMPGSDAVKDVVVPELEAAPVGPVKQAPVVAAAPRKVTKPKSLVPPAELRPLFEVTAQEFGVPANVLMAIVQQESSYNNDATNSETGAAGMAQYMGATAKSLKINPRDPNESIPATAMQIAERLGKGMSIDDAIREHFAGPNKKLWGPKTAAYGTEVLAKAEQIGNELYGAPAPVEQPKDQNNFAADRQGRADYEKNFRSLNPRADQAAVDMALGQYDEQAKTRTKAKGSTVTDRFAALQSPEAMFNQRLDAKLQAGNKGVAQVAPGRQQPDDVNTLPSRERPGVVDQAVGDFGRGIENLRALGYGAGGLAADAAGDEEAATQMLDEYVNIQNDIAKNNPATIGTYKNVKSLGDAGRYAVEAVAENLPMLIPSLLSGGFGAQVAKKGAERLVGGMIEAQVAKGVAKEVAERQAAQFIAKRVMAGSVAGAVPASVAMEAGSIGGDIYKETGRVESGTALAYGIPAGLLDSVGPVMALRKIAGPIVDEVAGSVIRRLGAEAGKQFLAEAGTEGLQTIIEQAASAKEANRDLWTPELLDNVIDAALKGGIGGGVMGVASQGVAEARGAMAQPQAGQPQRIEPTMTEAPAQPVMEQPAPIVEQAPAQADDEGFTAQIMGDDGLMHTIDSRTGVTMAEAPVEPKGMLETAIKQAAEQHASDPVAAPPTVASELPRIVVGPNPNSFINSNAQAARDLSDQRGLTGRIEDEFAIGKTAKQVQNVFENDLAFLPPEERGGFIIGVRATLGIPSRGNVDGQQEFGSWKQAYDQRKVFASQPPAPPAPPDYSAMPMDELSARLKEVAQLSQQGDGQRKQLAPERKAIERAINDRAKQAKADSKPAEESLSIGPFDDMKAANKMMSRYAEATGVPHEVVGSDGSFRVQRIEENNDDGRSNVDNGGVRDVSMAGTQVAQEAGSSISAGREVDTQPGGIGEAIPNAPEQRTGADVSRSDLPADEKPALKDYERNPYQAYAFSKPEEGAQGLMEKRAIDATKFEVKQTGPVRWQVVPRTQPVEAEVMPDVSERTQVPEEAPVESGAQSAPQAEVKPEQATGPINLVRMTNAADFDWSKIKPNGTYASIADDPASFVSPFSDDYKEGRRVDLQYTPKKPLVVGELKAKHARFRGALNNEGETSAGVKALHAFLTPDQFTSAMQMSKPQVQDAIAKKFPKVDASKAHDAYEALEIWGAQEAKANGHDVIIARDEAMPEFSEAVLLEGAVEPKPKREPSSIERETTNPSSWVIRNKTTGEAVLETADQKKVEAINKAKYEAVPILQHLQEVNDPKSKAGKYARRNTEDAPPTKPKRAAAPKSGKAKSKAEPIVMSEESYLATNGASRQGFGDAALHRSSSNVGESTKRNAIERQSKKDSELAARREELRAEYQKKVAAGEMRPPTSKEENDRTAQGDPDSEATQAALRIQEKIAKRKAAKFSVADELTDSPDAPITAAMQKLADDGKIVLHDDAASLPFEGKMPAGVQAMTAKDGTIHVVAGSDMAVVLHEAFHSGAQKLIGTAKWNSLMTRLDALYRQSERSTGKAREFFDAARGRVATAKAKGAVADGMAVEEFGAYAIEEYESAPLTVRKWADDMIGAVKAWALRRFGAQLGKVSPAQLSALAKSALLDIRASREQSSFSLMDQVKTAAFKRWFGKSQVADKDGAPMVVYHGTFRDFNEFKTGGELGAHFGSVEQANYFTDEPGSRLIPAYLSIQNPLRLSDAGTFRAEKVVPQLIEKGILPPDAKGSDYLASDGIRESADGTRKLQDAIKRAGYDGVVYDNTQEGDGESWIAFEPSQIKSATGNAGTFDPNNADIRFSVAGSPQPRSLTPDEQGMLRRVQAQIQDANNRVKQVQDRIKKVTGVDDLGNADYYRAETNRPGRIAARKEDARDKMFGPLMANLAKAGYKPAQLEEILHAQHAKERNANIAAINPEHDPASPEYSGTQGSGMNDDKADEILNKYANEPELKRFADQARNIAKETLELKLQYGLITKEDHDSLVKAYDNYVPLKGDGQYGPKVKRAMGHGARNENIMENIARDYEQAVVVGEKNLARQSLLQMVLQFPDDGLWTARVPPKGRMIAGKVYNIVDVGPTAPANGETVASFTSRSQVDAFLEGLGANRVNHKVLDSNGEQVAEFTKPLQDNEVMVYLKGDPVRLQIFDESLAGQLRPLHGEQMNAVLDLMRRHNRYLSMIFTGYNPAFIIKNATRDAITGTINMTGNHGAVTSAKAWAKYPMAWATMLQWAATKKTPNTAMGRVLDEYRAQGGKTGASYMSDLEEQGKNLARMFDDAKGAFSYAKDGQVGKAAWITARKAIGGLAHVVEVLNQAFENALRLALFAQLRAEGQKPGIAAAAAKSVTVNFDRKGVMTPQLGAFYLFINPAIQGTANMSRTMTQGENKYQAWALTGMMAAAGFAAAVHGMDDDKDRWLGESWGNRTKGLRFRVGETTLNVPMSYEFAPFYAIGVAMGEVARGESSMRAAVRVMSSFLDAYYPMQGAVQPGSDNNGMDLLLAHLPTVARVPGQVWLNRNSFGSQVIPETNTTKNRPDNLKMNRGTKNSVYDKTAQAIADAGELVGADKYSNDLTKISPETLKLIYSTYTGGLGRFIADSAGFAGLSTNGDVNLELADVPILKDFARGDNMKPIRTRYFDLSDEARKTIDEFAQAKKMGDRDEMKRIVKDPERRMHLALTKMVKSVNEVQGIFSDQAVLINADKDLTPAEKRAKLKEIENEQEAIYRKSIKAFQPQ